MSLALETEETPIRIVGLDGSSTLGKLFLLPFGDRGSRPETVGKRLNDADLSFLPVRIGERVELVHLAWVAYLAVTGRPADVQQREAVGARRARVELELANGETLSGDLLYTLPAGHSRVSDLLNSPGERFLLLVAEPETMFVHRAAIRRARGG